MDKLTRKLEHRNRLYSKLVKLQKQIKVLDREITYLKEVDEILQSDHAPILGNPETGEPRLRTEPAGPVPSLPEAASPRPTEPPRPKAAPKGPPCTACGSVGTLHRTNKSLSNGRQVPMIVCADCKTETLG